MICLLEVLVSTCRVYESHACVNKPSDLAKMSSFSLLEDIFLLELLLLLDAHLQVLA